MTHESPITTLFGTYSRIHFIKKYLVIDPPES